MCFELLAEESSEWIFKPWYTPLVEPTSAGTAKKRQP